MLAHVFSPEAAEERDRIVEGLYYYRSERAAQRFLIALESALELLGGQPEIGTRRSLALWAEVYRWPFNDGAHLLFYRLLPEAILIVQIFPTATNPSGLRFA
jgi:plasmid stabilization system protein ParE